MKRLISSSNLTSDDRRSEYPTDCRYYVYDEEGECVSDSFLYESDAIEYAVENGYPVVKVHNYYIDRGKYYPDGDPEVVWSETL